MKKKSKPSLIERLRMKKTANAPIQLGVSWYENAEDWAVIKQQSLDPDRFESSYPEWLDMVETALQDLRAVNQLPLKVILKPEEYFAWCSDHAKSIDAASRAEFVSYLLGNNLAKIV